MNTQKQLTQAVFDGLPSEYRWAFICCEGSGWVYEREPKPFDSDFDDWDHTCGGKFKHLGEGYDTTNWKNSKIERAADPITALCDKRVDADLTHHVELIDDQIESEKSKLRETVARLEITVRTQGENIAAYQKSLLECNDQCERKDAQITDAKARIENHITQAVEYERYIKELDAKCLRLTEPSNAYDDHNAHQEFIDGLGRGAKYTVVLLAAMAVIAFLMTMGWVGGAV